MNNELKHYGVLGMKWGVRKDKVKTTKAKKTPLTKEEKISRNERRIKIGASVAAGLLSSGFGAGAVYGITGSETAAEMLAPTLGVIGGMKYYEWINS